MGRRKISPNRAPQLCFDAGDVSQRLSWNSRSFPDITASKSKSIGRSCGVRKFATIDGHTMATKMSGKG